MLVFCLLESLLFLVSIQIKVPWIFSSLSRHFFPHKLYYFHCSFAELKVYQDIYGTMAENLVCIRQNNLYEPSVHMDLLKCHDSLFHFVFVF